MILSGDIGGTKSVLALYERANGSLREVHSARLASDGHGSLEGLLEQFLEQSRVRIASAAFGVAGPVLDGRVTGTNLPWSADARALSAHLGIPRVALLNDLEATAYGVAGLGAQDLVAIQPGEPLPDGAVGVIAAGTGLGEAFLRREGGVPAAHASEGGHADFAPQSAEQDALLVWLRQRLGGHVSYERVLSGPGLGNVYAFLRDTGRAEEPEWLARARAEGDPNAAITAADGRAEIATRALDLFIEVYGAEAGNLALRFLATGGVYLAGGIAPKLRPRLLDGRFRRAFLDKGRLRPLLESIPVWLVLNERTAVLGAALVAFRQAGDPLD